MKNRPHAEYRKRHDRLGLPAHLSTICLGLALLNTGSAHGETFLESLVSGSALLISVSSLDAGGIVIESGASRIHWFCPIVADDPSLCRGRADRARTTLKYFGRRPVTFINDGLMIYRSGPKIVGVQIDYAARSQQEMIETFAPYIRNRFEESERAASRACGKNDAATAIQSAQANYNERSSSICADVGLMQITWRFAVYMGAVDPKQRLLKLTIRTPDLPGNDTLWF
jgi:hypothetical protein